MFKTSGQERGIFFRPYTVSGVGNGSGRSNVSDRNLAKPLRSLSVLNCCKYFEAKQSKLFSVCQVLSFHGRWRWKVEGVEVAERWRGGRVE